MKNLLAALSIVTMSAACRAQPPSSPDAPALVSPGGKGAASPKAVPRSPAELDALKKLSWIGDADVNLNTPFQKRFALSGYFGTAVGARPTFTTAGYALRHGTVTGRQGHLVVDDTETGLKLKIYENNDFTAKGVVFEMSIGGALDQLTVEMALDKLALLTWNGDKPRLTVYRQGKTTALWHVDLDVRRHVGDMVVAWHPSGELTVEWRSESNYERFIIDGRTGAVLLREALDPAIVKAVLDPISYMEGIAPPTDAAPSTDPAKRTFVAGILQRPHNLVQLCPARERQTVIARAVEVQPGLVLAVGALYGDRGDSPQPEVLKGGQCPAAVVLDAKTLQVKGRWARAWNP